MEFKYDAFISYRHEGGEDFAKRLKQCLEMFGVVCFLDDDSLKLGYFDEKLLKAIDGSRIVLPILTDGSLDRCQEDGDWVRKEITYALSQGKDILPIAKCSDFAQLFRNLPDEMARLPDIQRADVSNCRDLQREVHVIVERYFDWVGSRERDFRRAIKQRWGEHKRISDKSRTELRDLAVEKGIPQVRCDVIMGEEERDLVQPATCSRYITHALAVIIVVVIVSVVCLWQRIGLPDERKNSDLPQEANRSFVVQAQQESAADDRITVCGNKDENRQQAEQGIKPVSRRDSDADNPSLVKMLSDLPSVRSVCKFSLVSSRGLRVKPVWHTVKKGGDSEAGSYFDYLLKIEIDRNLYDAKIAPALCAAFAEVTVTPQSVVRMRNGVRLCGDRRSTQEKIFDAYVSQDEKRHSSLSTEGSDAKGDEAARLSSTVLGDCRGLSCSARIGDGRKENMKAVVLTDISIPLTQAKGKMYELTPDVFDKIDAWRDRQESELEFDVVLLDGKGGELAVSSVKLRSYQLSYCNYMDYFGKEHRALLVAPFVGGSSLACYKWVRFEISAEDAGRVASMKVE